MAASNYFNIKVCEFQTNEKLKNSKMCGKVKKAVYEDMVDVKQDEEVIFFYIYNLKNYNFYN
jgi:hypothetical protein